MKQYSKETLETANELRLIDDALFRLVAARKEACQEIIRTLLGDDKLEVIQTTPQETVTSLYREVSLDALCRLEDGRLVNIEVQKGTQNDDVRRCRFHLSTITANKTPKGTDFKNVPDVAVLYITEYDALKNGQSVTCSEMCQCVDGKYVPVNDGAKIYYANTVVNDNTDKAELLALFLKRDAFVDSRFPNLSEAMRYFKEDEKGLIEVCNIVEEYAKSYAEEQIREQAREFAIYLIHDGKDLYEVSKATHLSIEEIEELCNR